MVVDRLHIICGNCGSNDGFDFQIKKDEEGNDVYIFCDNCSTLHSLGKYASEREERE